MFKIQNINSHIIEVFRFHKTVRNAIRLLFRHFRLVPKP